MMNIELGDEAQCKVTGFKGVVTSLAKCLTGCDRATIQPPIGKDGKYPDCLWIDVAALKLLKKGKVTAQSVREADPAKKGGPATRSTVHQR